MENTGRQVKDLLYAQVARIGKAVCSPKRRELIDLLCQGEKPVERLAPSGTSTPFPAGGRSVAGKRMAGS
jgi:hypothetical protein